VAAATPTSKERTRQRQEDNEHASASLLACPSPKITLYRHRLKPRQCGLPIGKQHVHHILTRVNVVA
jgi:ribosomal protein L32